MNDEFRTRRFFGWERLQVSGNITFQHSLQITASRRAGRSRALPYHRRLPYLRRLPFHRRLPFLLFRR